MPEYGTVKWYDDSKGYGFIARERGPDLFVDRDGIASEGFKILHEGDHVAFDVVDGRKGPQAKNVVKLS
jgi:CspA family cold shock protein